MKFIKKVIKLLKNCELSVFGKEFGIIIQYDLVEGSRYLEFEVPKELEPRVYIQLEYDDINYKNGEHETYRSRKWYLSEHMTNDEIIKTLYLAFEICVKHEILEGFKIKGKPLFNPHVSYKELLKIKKETKR